MKARQPKRNWISVLSILAAAFVVPIDAGHVQVTRLNDKQPIISEATFTAVGLTGDGQSINGPSVIRIPSWVAAKADGSANYYCYFGDHVGGYIRMAWAANIEGPWTLFNVGSNDDPAYPGRGVFDVGNSQISFTNGNAIRRSHISSPDAVVDDVNQRILLFFHCGDHTDNSVDGVKWFDTGSQVTVVATSKTGLNFNGGIQVSSGGVGPGETGTDQTGERFGLKSKPLGNAYFRTFIYNSRYYAFTNYGPIWAGPTSGQPWSSNWSHVKWSKGTLTGGGNPIWDDLMENFAQVGAVAPRHYAGTNGSDGSPYGLNQPKTGAPRHFATRMLRDGKTLEIYYTCRGEMPERVFRTTMDLSSGDYTSWNTVSNGMADVHDEIIRPTEAWEGATLTPTISKNGGETNANALRDPYVFTDMDGKSYIFYSGNPESAIGVASVNNLPTASFNLNKASILEGESVTAMASASDTDGTISSYAWNWGDGSSSTGANESHTYTSAGNYTITLTVTDNVGGSTVIMELVTVVPTEAPTFFPTGPPSDAPSSLRTSTSSTFPPSASMTMQTGTPSAQPSHIPTTSPSSTPMTMEAGTPSAQPSVIPTTSPSEDVASPKPEDPPTSSPLSDEAPPTSSAHSLYHRVFPTMIWAILVGVMVGF